VRAREEQVSLLLERRGLTGEGSPPRRRHRVVVEQSRRA
jgi:hypothetical protein